MSLTYTQSKLNMQSFPKIKKNKKKKPPKLPALFVTSAFTLADKTTEVLIEI